VADTFAQMTRQLQLWVPELPPFLAQRFVRDRYRRLADLRPWGALRAEGEFLPNAATTAGTATMTRGSPLVVGIETGWTSAEVGRQFQANSRAPIYTILSVEGPLALTLDRPFGGDSGTGLYRILDAYVTVPSDFRSFMVVLDPRRSWRLQHWVTQQELALLDPGRSSAGTPWALVDRRFSSTTRRPQYELWPYCTIASNYPFYYIKQVADLAADDDEPFYPLTGAEIVRGALADLARWPGTAATPNPMFEHALELARSFEAEARDMLENLERQDEETFMTWLTTVDWASWPSAPIDAAFMQNHAF
jgi:hypothetical protein